MTVRSTEDLYIFTDKGATAKQLMYFPPLNLYAFKPLRLILLPDPYYESH